MADARCSVFDVRRAMLDVQCPVLDVPALSRLAEAG